jgi:septal ring factor EnvC (AmiA/AmiB activator)
MADTDGITQLKVDVGVLKNQVSLLSTICGKLDTIIDKLVDQHDRHIAKVYTDMDVRREQTEKDISEIHERIDTVIDKLHDTEIAIMNEMKALRKEINEHNAAEKESLNKLLQWKWFVAGGILALSWLISHGNIDTILKYVK